MMQEKTPGVLSWLRIPGEALGALVLFVAVMIGLVTLLPRGFGTPLAMLAAWLLFVGAVMARTCWNFYRLWKKKAPYFWVISVAMVWFGIVAFGILLAIAVPNLERYGSKARQSEAKIALATIYGVEAAYFAENKKYAFSIEAIGYMPEGQKRFYMIGFPDACAAILGVPPAKAQYRVQGSELGMAREQEILDFFRSVKSCPDPAQGFEAYAVGALKQGAPLDVWKIDQNKMLMNVQSGF